MAVVTVDNSLHARIKRLALDTGVTIGQLVHQGCEHIVEKGEKALVELKKKKIAK
jgi:hypothetical protein